MKAKICSRLFHYSISALLTICTVSAQSTTGDDGCQDPSAKRFCNLAHQECDSFTMDSARPLTFGQKTCYWRAQLFTGSAVFGAAFFGGIALANHTPKEWPLGAQGFGEQFGTRYAQGMLKSTTTYLIGVADREDPRPKPPNVNCHAVHYSYENRWARLGASLLRVIYTQQDQSCKNMPAFSRIGGSLASGFVELSYLPPSQRKVSNAWLGSAGALGGYAANSVWSEFQGDIFGLLGKVFPTGKPRQ